MTGWSAAMRCTPARCHPAPRITGAVHYVYSVLNFAAEEE